MYCTFDITMCCFWSLSKWIKINKKWLSTLWQQNNNFNLYWKNIIVYIINIYISFWKEHNCLFRRVKCQFVKSDTIKSEVTRFAYSRSTTYLFTTYLSLYCFWLLTQWQSYVFSDNVDQSRLQMWPSILCT